MSGDTDLSKFTEVSLLGPPTERNLRGLCESALRRRAYGVTVPVGAVALCREILGDSDTKVIASLASNHFDVRRYETEVAVDDGAHEIVVSVDHLLEKPEAVVRELRDIVEAADERIVQAHISSQTESEIVASCEAILESGVRFVSLGHVNPPEKLIESVRAIVGARWGLKVSIGAFQQNIAEPGPEATLADVGHFQFEQTLLKRSVGDKRALIAAGATRLAAVYVAR
jgi:deoxyribose-phosphate aldolase